VALSWILFATEVRGEITEIWWLEGRQFKVGLLNLAQME
jgi:hypothetical protein